MRKAVVGACRFLGKYVLQEGTGTSHYGPLGRLSPCVTCAGRCATQGDNHGLGDRVIQLSISLLLAGHLVVQALEKVPVQCSQCGHASGTGWLFWCGWSSSMLHDAEGGEGDASDLSFSMCPSSPILAALLSLVSIPVTPTGAWAGQWGKEEKPNRAKQGKTEQAGPAQWFRVWNKSSIMDITAAHGPSFWWHIHRGGIGMAPAACFGRTGMTHGSDIAPFCNALTSELLCCFMSTVC